MKKFTIALAAVLLLTTLAACKKKTEHSPTITFGKITVNNELVEENIVHVGDTIRFYMVLDAYTNTLTNFNVNTDRSFLKDSVMSAADFATFCNTEQSDKSKGIYVFNNLGAGTSLVLNPLHIVAVKSPNSDDKAVTLEFQLKNDSSFGEEYNPVSYKFKFKVLEKEENKDENTDENGGGDENNGNENNNNNGEGE